MEHVTVGLIGLGTVGTGVARLLTEHSERIARRAGVPVRLAGVAVRDPDKPRAGRLDGIRITTDASQLIDDPEIDIIIEAMGGTDPALQYVLAALAEGKHVVTANKALLAEHGIKVFAQARASGRGRVRGERRRRNPDRPSVGFCARREPGSEPGRDSQRHLQLHPDSDDQRGFGL